MQRATVLRHLILNGKWGDAVGAVLQWPLQRLRWIWKRSLTRRITALSSAEERFEYIFRRNLWNDPSSRSGFGSSPAATERVRAELPSILAEFDIQTLFDAPCGDFAWMRDVIRDQPNVRYIGADIVKPLVEQNTRRYGSEGIEFHHMDLTQGPYPAADLMLCRDCLLHLSYADIRSVLTEFVASKIPLLLTSTHRNMDGFVNHDIVTGSWRRIDLFLPPFEFPSDPIRRFDDGIAPDPPRELCLWSRDQIAASLNRLVL